ncbi:MAG: hypothetical protein NVS2B16_09190 [Chloroflexota bacterium]
MPVTGTPVLFVDFRAGFARIGDALPNHNKVLANHLAVSILQMGANLNDRFQALGARRQFDPDRNLEG